jgi:flagellar basal body-associated protein FliL
MEENKPEIKPESKKTKMIVVVFLLIVVAVSGYIMLKLYKAESAKTGTTVTKTY